MTETDTRRATGGGRSGEVPWVQSGTCHTLQAPSSPLYDWQR